MGTTPDPLAAMDNPRAIAPADNHDPLAAMDSPATQAAPLYVQETHPTPTAESDPLAAMDAGHVAAPIKSLYTGSTDPLAAMDQDVTQKYGNSPSTYGLTAEERAYGQKNPEEMTDEPWY